MPFPDEPTLHGNPLSDVDGAGMSHSEWMAAVGAASDAHTTQLADIAVGPVIADQSDGHTYRIICTNGVLSTVQVT